MSDDWPNRRWAQYVGLVVVLLALAALFAGIGIAKADPPPTDAPAPAQPSTAPTVPPRGPWTPHSCSPQSPDMCAVWAP
jgi:hypothetical protein